MYQMFPKTGRELRVFDSFSSVNENIRAVLKKKKSPVLCTLGCSDWEVYPLILESGFGFKFRVDSLL